jgi:hypothetical protein
MLNTRNLSLVGLVVLIFGATSTYASVKKNECLHKRNTICRNMHKLNPTMDLKEAYKLSNLFNKFAIQYDISPTLLVSIAFQESSFKTDAVRKVTGLVFDNESKKYKKVRVGSDFCMMQIHMININKMDLKVDKLLNSPSYCIETGAKILSRYKGLYGKKNENWWTHYNAKSKAKQNIYYNKVSRHLKKIDLKRNAKRVVASTK